MDFAWCRATVTSPALPPVYGKRVNKLSVLVRKKTPNPFIVACDKFIYIEILKKQSEAKVETKETDEPSVDSITRKEINLIASTIRDLSDEDGWAFLGDVGSLLQKKRPNFDSRNYGFEKLTPLIKSIDKFEIEQRENHKSRYKLIFVRIK